MNSMKKSLIALCGVFAYVGVASADDVNLRQEYVDSYNKSDGTLVRGHFRLSEELLTRVDLNDAQVDLDAGLAVNFTQSDLDIFGAQMTVNGAFENKYTVIDVLDAQKLMDRSLDASDNMRTTVVGGVVNWELVANIAVDEIDAIDTGVVDGGGNAVLSTVTIKDHFTYNEIVALMDSNVVVDVDHALHGYNITNAQLIVWADAIMAHRAIDGKAIVDSAFEDGTVLTDLLSAAMIVEKGVVSVVTPRDILDAKENVTAAFFDANTAGANYPEAKVKIESLIAARQTLADGLVTPGTFPELMIAQGVLDDFRSTDSERTIAQAIIDNGLKPGVELTVLVNAQAKLDFMDSEFTLEELIAFRDLEEAGEFGEADVITQEQVAAAQAILDVGLVNVATIEGLIAAQTIVDDENSSPEAILAAQAILDEGLAAGVDWSEVATALGILNADSVAGEIVDDTGLSDVESTVAQTVAEIKQELQDLGIVANVDTPEGEALVKALVEGGLVDTAKELKASGLITDEIMETMEDVEFVRVIGDNNLLDAAKALGGSDDSNAVLVAAWEVSHGTMTIADVNTKLSADIGSVTSSATAGSSAVSSAVGGHQANVVASSGKYGLKKYSSFKLGDTGVSSGGESRSGGVWMKAFGSDSEMDMRDSVAGYDANTYGVVIGADTTIENDAVVGFAFSFADIDVTGKSVANAQTDTDQYQGTLYGTLFMDDYFVNGSLAYASSSSDTSRSGLEGTLKGSYDTEIYSASVGAGMPMDMDGYAIIPQVTMAYSSISPDSYTEEGNGALKIDVESMNTFGIQAGVTLMTNIDLGRSSFIPKLRLIADWDVLQEKAQVNSSWASTGTTITPTFGAEPAALGGIIGAGFDYATDDGTYVLSLDYDLSTRSDFVSHAGSVKARINF